MGEHLKNGEFYAKGAKIFRAPIETKTETGCTIDIGFPVATVSEYVSVVNVVECLNASRHHAALVKALEEIQAYSNDPVAIRMAHETLRSVAPHPAAEPREGV